MAHNIPSTGYLRLVQILGNPKAGVPPLIPVSRTSWYRGIAAGKYPVPIQIGPRTSVYRAEDIRDLIDRLAAGA